MTGAMLPTKLLSITGTFTTILALSRRGKEATRTGSARRLARYCKGAQWKIMIRDFDNRHWDLPVAVLDQGTDLSLLSSGVVNPALTKSCSHQREETSRFWPDQRSLESCTMGEKCCCTSTPLTRLVRLAGSGSTPIGTFHCRVATREGGL